jgi:hypothetical protein
MAMPAQGNMAMLARLLMAKKQGVPPQMQQPYMGLGGLPPYEQPGASLDPAAYISSPPPAAQRPGPSMVPPDVVANTQPQAQLPPANVTAADPGALPPADMQAADIPPMPAPIAVGDGSIRGDINTAIQQLIAQKKIAPNQFAEMFPQVAGGSLTQLAGGR